MKQRADGRWLKVKTINGERINFYSKAKTEKAALKDIEKQMLLYIESKARKKSSKGNFSIETREVYISCK